MALKHEEQELKFERFLKDFTFLFEPKYLINMLENLIACLEDFTVQQKCKLRQSGISS